MLTFNIYLKGFFQKSHTMESYHQAFFGPDDPKSRLIARQGLYAIETTLELARK